jgi:thioredoxin reductase
MSSSSSLPQKRVAVIGAGPSGLTAARSIAGQINTEKNELNFFFEGKPFRMDAKLAYLNDWMELAAFGKWPPPHQQQRRAQIVGVLPEGKI